MNQNFIQGLVDKAEEMETAAEGTGLTWLRGIRNQCLAKVAAGGGEIAFVTQAIQNGKQGTQEARLDCAELLGAVSRALHLLQDTGVSLTYVDFSQLRV